MKHLVDKDWGNITKTSVGELQDLISTTYEEGLSKFAELKKVNDPNRKRKPPKEIIKYLRIKKKALKKLRLKILSDSERSKNINRIAACERNIRNYYQEKEETKEKEAWERKKQNSRFFFRLAKLKT